ncbi:MAG: DUF58 domain-containing protein [Rickettsiaceae bacterium]|nr:DUF58 domain-containing protein [Rickettsiaceae bacterium]
MLYPEFEELLQLRAKATNIALISKRPVTSTTAGSHISPFRGQGLEFEEVREYTYGDDIRNIDWRVTARTGKPHLKLFTEERERSVVLCVDMNKNMHFGTRGTFKSVQAAKIAATIAWAANKNHDRVGACLYGDLLQDGREYFAPKRSRKSLLSMLKTLCITKDCVNKVEKDMEQISTSIKPLDDTVLYLNKMVNSGTLIFIISDFMNITETLEQCLINLHKRNEVVLIPVNDPADKEIPAAGNIIFSEYDIRQNLHVNTNNNNGRKAYKQQWLDNQQKLEDLASKLHIGVIHIATNEDFCHKLAYNLKIVNLFNKGA